MSLNGGGVTHGEDIIGGVTPLLQGVGFSGGILPLLLHRLRGSILGFLLPFSCPHCFFGGTVHHPLCGALKQADAPWCIAGTPETLHKVTSMMRE
jgi:hypothetical protein